MSFATVEELEGYLAITFDAGATAAAITNKALTSNVATLGTAAPHGFGVAQTVVVTGVDSTFNGSFTITAVTPATFSYAKTHADVASAAATGVATTGADRAQAQAMLDQATAEMLEHMDRDVTVIANDVVTLDASGPSLLLPAWPVTAVSEVTVDGVALSLPGDIQWYPDGRLFRLAGGSPMSWGVKRQSIVVTYSHGETTSAGLKSVCMARAGRLLENPTAVANESSGAITVNYGVAPGEVFLAEEKALMGRVPAVA